MTKRGAGAAIAIAAIGALALLGGGLDWLRGYAMYHGHIKISGRISGHGFDLPAHALRCVSCHESKETTSGDLSLDLATLSVARSRRGGPASAYNPESFCALLRTGVDPATIMIERTMPRFDIADADCRALWTYLGNRP